jgi:4-hydroxybenzoate polyprenyltransferase
VASGQISVGAAWAFVIGCSLLSLAILLSLNLVAVALGVASLALVAVYPFMKRITWWPQAWLGLTFNWGALLGFAAASGRLTLAPGLLYASGVFWTLGYDTIYAVQDLEDDALAGVKSSARRLRAAAPPAVFAFYVFAVASALAAGWAVRLGPLFYAGAALYAASLIRQPLALKLDDPAGALALFKANTFAGLILFAAIVAGVWRP